MRKFFTLACLFILLTACEGPHLFRRSPPIVRDYDSDAFTRVAVMQATRLSHEWRWYMEDAWIRYDDFGTVNHICLKYRTQNLLELQEARGKIVDFVEELMEGLQNNPITSAHMNPDFSPADLEIHVDFQSYYGYYVDPLYIGCMVLEDGMVYYYDFNTKNRNVDFWNSRIETFAKSQEVVHVERESEDLYRSTFMVPAESQDNTQTIDLGYQRTKDLPKSNPLSNPGNKLPVAPATASPPLSRTAPAGSPSSGSAAPFGFGSLK